MHESLVEIIFIGLKSWGLLALGLGTLFLVLLILDSFANKKK